MHLSSLPDRPFELAELRELNEAGRFRAVFPAAVFDIDGSEAKLVPAAVLVTPGEEGRVVGVGYDLDSGWTRVASEQAGEAVQGQLEAVGRDLQEWARETEQRWAGAEGPTALVEHVREKRGD